nr:hypothetical protein [Tanacetum cinerariifolium]
MTYLVADSTLDCARSYFVVLDFIADPRVPLILGRPFLSTTHAIINVHEKEIILRQDNQSLTIQYGDTPSIKKVEQLNKIDFIDAGKSDSEEIENFLNDDSIPIGVENSPFNMEEDILFLEGLLREDLSPPPPVIPNQTKSSIKEPEHLFSMWYEHLSTTLVTKEVAESSTKNLVPILLFTTFSNPLFNNDEITDELESHVESTSNHDTVKFDNLDEFSGPLIPIHIAEEERIRREHADYINRMEILFTINPRPHPSMNANTNVESIPSLPISVQDNDSQREEIDIVTSTDDVLPLSVENDDSDGEVDAVNELRFDNSISNSEHEYSESEESDVDNPSVPLPPPEPPDEEFDFEIDFEDEISVVRNTIVEFECIDARVKFDVSNDENDDYSYFKFVEVFSYSPLRVRILSLTLIVTIGFTLTVLSALRRSGNENKQACLVPVKLNSYYQAFNVKSLFGEIVSPKKSQVKLKGPKEANNSAGTQTNDDQGANLEEIDLHKEHFVLPICSAYLTAVKSSGDKIEKNTDFKTCEKP